MVDEFRRAARSLTSRHRFCASRSRARNRVDPSRNPADQAGATLLEVIVAVMLVSMVVLGLATAFVTLMRINRGNAEQQRIDHAVDNVAEQLKAVPYVASGDRLAQYTTALALPPSTSAQPTVTLQRVECRVRSTAATAASADAYDAACTTDGGTQRVTVRGDWRGRSREAQIVVRNR